MTIEITFSASATVNQEIELVDGVDYNSKEIAQGLAEGKFFTTLNSDGVLFEFVDGDLVPIGKIVNQQVENSDYFDFEPTE
jgi:hypothetical protein